jgi:hypothetical protein
VPGESALIPVSSPLVGVGLNTWSKPVSPGTSVSTLRNSHSATSAELGASRRTTGSQTNAVRRCACLGVGKGAGRKTGCATGSGWSGGVLGNESGVTGAGGWRTTSASAKNSAGPSGGVWAGALSARPRQPPSANR